MRVMPYARGWHDVRVKPSGKFEARWSDESGQARGKSFLTESQARNYAFNRAKEILDGATGLAVPTKDIRDAVTEFIGRYTDQGTVAIYSRHLDTFLDAHPQVTRTGHMSKTIFETYNVTLEREGHNSGGCRHILKSLKTFANYCLEKGWLRVNPFFKFRLPRQEFEGRALNPEEYARMISIDPQYEVDRWINLALRIGNPSMLRISTVWGLVAEDFQAPDRLRIRAIKEQPGVWTYLHPEAHQALLELLICAVPNQRLFSYWPSVDSMRQSLRKKASRVGLKGVRFHDACKVTRVTELDAAGFGLGKIAALSNTSKATLAKHYIKADRRAAFKEYQTYGGPTNGLKQAIITPLAPIDPTDTTNENDANLQAV